jgi:hypothetical protein
MTKLMSVAKQPIDRHTFLPPADITCSLYPSLLLILRQTRRVVLVEVLSFGRHGDGAKVKVGCETYQALSLL